MWILNNFVLFIFLVYDFTNVKLVILFLSLLHCLFLSTTVCWNSSVTAPYTWVINSCDLEQSSWDYTTPDVTLRRFLMSQKLLTYSSHLQHLNPFSYVSLNLIINVWVQLNVTSSHFYSLCCKTGASWILQWFRFYKQEPEFIARTILPKALLTSWNCIFYYRIHYYLINNPARKHWELLWTQSEDLHTYTLLMRTASLDFNLSDLCLCI